MTTKVSEAIDEYFSKMRPKRKLSYQEELLETILAILGEILNKVTK